MHAKTALKYQLIIFAQFTVNKRVSGETLTTLLKFVIFQLPFAEMPLQLMFLSLSVILTPSKFCIRDFP